MPNHVYNIVTFDCSAEKAQEILSAVEMEGRGLGSVDFEKLIPMPEDLYKGPLGMEQMRQYPGDLNWYDWSVNHWGTKWNAYGYEDLPRIENALVFNTAWSSVPAVIGALSEKYPDVSMEYCWADEDFGSNTGMLVFKGGEIRDGYIPEDGSPEAYAFAAAVQGMPEAELASFLDQPETEKGAREPAPKDKGAER